MATAFLFFAMILNIYSVKIINKQWQDICKILIYIPLIIDQTFTCNYYLLFPVLKTLLTKYVSHFLSDGVSNYIVIRQPFYSNLRLLNQ
jgi:uncharacterized protein YqhQ